MPQTGTPSLGWQNKFSTTLSSGITASDTTIPLTNLPTPTEGFLIIEPDSATAWEVIYYTSKTGSAVVCPSVGAGRGQDDSSATSHSSGATVRMDTTAGMFEVLQNGSSLGLTSIATANIATDAVTDAKLIYGKLRSRQGGSATDWTSQGTSNFDYSATNTFMQAGTRSLNTAHASTAITFPTAFNQKPLVVATTASANSSNDIYATVRDITTTGFNLYNNSAGNGTTETANWIAIGE